MSGWKISNDVINWINLNIPKNSTIIEFGSGDGTTFLVENYKVYSIEDKIEWVDYVPKSNYIYAPLNDNDKWYDTSILKSKLPNNYDLIIIDGPASSERYSFVNHLDLLKTNIPIIVDDVERENDFLMLCELSLKLNRTYVIHNCTDSNKKFGIIDLKK
jgi:hypothetical protein